MAIKYAEHFAPDRTPQGEQADARQVKNSAGGYTFEVTPFHRLERFLILGAEGGTYYATERAITRENARCVEACLDADPGKTLQTIGAVSYSGRAPKNDPAIFALALALTNDKSKSLAVDYVPYICRTATHLFQLVDTVTKFRKWGRSLRRSVGKWYESKSADQLCYQLAKYQQREGWSHRDLLRLGHVQLVGADKQAAGRWAVGAAAEARAVNASKSGRKAHEYAAVDVPRFLAAFDELKRADLTRTIALVKEFGFTHEMVASEHKNSAHLWDALLEKMPMTAMIRNLGKLTAVGLVKPLSSATKTIADRLVDRERLRKARVHPMTLYVAGRVYAQGHGDKGNLHWTPEHAITDALDAGFYEAFGAIEPSGARMFLALDVSGSMTSATSIPQLDCRTAAAIMAMVTARAESRWCVFGFTAPATGGHGGKWGGGDPRLEPLDISPRMRLNEVVDRMTRIPMGGTDCSLPMRAAAKAGIEADGFAVFTDNETWAGPVHPHEALRTYRRQTGIAAKLAVQAFTPTSFTIADPTDAGMLDLVGLDSAAPAVLADFFSTRKRETLAQDEVDA